MKEIKLSVTDENLQTVLTILENLKSGLISAIQTDVKLKRTTQYKPKQNSIIKEENSGTADRTGKYVNPALFKERLRR